MPSQVMHQRRLPSSHAPFMYSFCSEEIRCPLQKQVGFWRSELPHDNAGSGRMPLLSGKTIAPPVEKFHSVSTSSPQNLELFQPCQVFKEPNSKTYSTPLKETDGKAASPITSWKTLEHGLGTPYGTVGKPLSLNNKINLNELPFENGQFSSSLPGMVKKKFTDGALFNQSTNNVYSNFEVDDTVESLKEIEDKAIGDLLPADDDELFSGVIGDVELEHVAQAKNGNDVDDDLFCSGGGIELEANAVHRQVDLNGRFCRGYDHDECPSRTVLVRNVNSGVEDAVLRFIFEQYGDIHTFNTSFKDRGLVMISYYDLRSACDAIRGLQDKLLMQRKLDIQYSVPGDYPSENDINQGMIVASNLDSSISNDYLRQLFGIYGEIKEIQEYTQKHQQLIEFYDIRAAEAAIHALNMSIIAGKEVQLEPQSGHAKCKFGSDKKESPPNSSSSILQGRIPIPFGERASNSFVDVKGASVDGHPNQSGDDLNCTMGQLSFDFPCIPTFHPHSMPEYHDGPVNNISSMTSSVGLNFLGRAEAVYNRHIPGMILGDVNSQSLVHNEESFGASGSDNYLLEGHQYPWSNSTSNQCPPGPLLWPHSSSRVGSIHSPHSQVIGLPMPPTVLNTVQTSHHHHVGSAPTGNPLLWDNCHAHKEDFTDTTAFHLCSLGNARFHGSPTMHPLGFGSVNMIPQVGRSRMETSISPPQRNYHMFHCGRNPIPMPVTLESPVDRFKSRKGDPSSNQTDIKKQYELDIERIIRGEDGRTTLMIKNIPNKYTSKMLLATIDEHHRGTYDFIYLPIDFKNKCNVGYAFINLIDSKHIIPFYKAFNGKKWEKFNSEKVASLAYARIQGKAALVSHFQNSSLMNEDKRCRPILFHSDGPNAGDQEPFPVGLNIRCRSGRHTAKTNEGSPSNSESGDEFGNGSNSTTGLADS